ncbi:hypothetical protein Tco_1285627 [Tanacetum coccineum]
MKQSQRSGGRTNDVLARCEPVLANSVRVDAIIQCLPGRGLRLVLCYPRSNKICLSLALQASVPPRTKRSQAVQEFDKLVMIGKVLYMLMIGDYPHGTREGIFWIEPKQVYLVFPLSTRVLVTMGRNISTLKPGGSGKFFIIGLLYTDSLLPSALRKTFTVQSNYSEVIDERSRVDVKCVHTSIRLLQDSQGFPQPVSSLASSALLQD